MIQARSHCLSAHLDSFCVKLNELSQADFEFLYQSAPGKMRQCVGWQLNAAYRNGPIDEATTERSKNCDLLIEMLRELGLMEERARAGRKTVYISERWFKPIPLINLRLFNRLLLVRLPGVVRLLVPSYRRMAKRFAKLMDDTNFYVFPIGVHAVRDMVRLYRIVHGDWRAFFCEPKVEVDRKLGGSVVGFPRMNLWAYFVEPSDLQTFNIKRQTSQLLKILWVGRMVALKRADALVRAFKVVAKRQSAALLLVGEGPERSYLERLAGMTRSESDCLEWAEGKIVFHDYVKNDKVRELLRAADVVVMTSNAEEGWCAVVSEALVEGCPVVGTYEAGSSMTLLTEDCLYHTGNVKELGQRLLSGRWKMLKYSSSSWSGTFAAKTLLDIVK